MRWHRIPIGRSNSQLEGVIESYELGYRMQAAVPEVMDLSGESESTLKHYGIGSPKTDDFGRQCLMARRFAEAGVRFVELTHEGIDHTKLTYRYVGRDFRLTDVYGRVADDIMV